MSLSKWPSSGHIEFFGLQTLTSVWLWISNPDSTSCLASNINSKLQLHITSVYGKKPIDFQICHLQNGRLVAILVFWFPDSNFSLALNFKSGLYLLLGFEYQVQSSVAHYKYVWKEAYWFSDMSLSKWPPGGHIGIFGFQTLTSVWLWISNPDSTSCLASNIKPKLQKHINSVYGKKPVDFQMCHFQNGRLVAILDFLVSRF